MSNTYIENIRSKHEEIEKYEKILSKTLLYKESNPKEKIYAENLMKEIIEKIQKLSRDLLDLYEDKDGYYNEENLIFLGKKRYSDSSLNFIYKEQNNKNSINNNNNSVNIIWKNFYDKLKEIKNNNKRNLNSDDVFDNISSDKLFNKLLENINKKISFNSEENKGRTLDLHSNYIEYINLKGLNNKELEYLSYLDIFYEFEKIPLKMRLDEDYKKYLNNLLLYLKNFFVKTKPFVDYNEIQDIIDDKFEEDWKIKKDKYFDNNNNIENKEKNEKENENEKDKESIKNNDNNIYCIYCNKIFNKQTIYNSHLTGKKHKKNVENFNKKNNINNNNNNNNKTNENKTLDNNNNNNNNNSIINSEIIDDNFRYTFYIEFQIYIYSFIFQSELTTTKNFIHQKQTMSLHEIELNTNNEEKISKISLDPISDKKIYNPKNVPIGWDGKPIPYWLYKIHGLGVEYKCEICGDASYWGRKSFEHHFQEWRHAYGMKCLGLPNTLQFKEVTTIVDALELHKKILEDNKKKEFTPEIEEQFEDKDGNVVNKKYYNDLVKQGLN